MIFALLGILMLYGWSFLQKKSRLNLLAMLVVLLMSLGVVVNISTLGLGWLPISLTIAKSWLFMGVVGVLLLRARESRVEQLMILVLSIWVGYKMLKAPSPAPQEAVHPELLASLVSSAVEEVESAYGVKIELLVQDNDRTDGFDIENMYTIDIPDHRLADRTTASLAADKRVQWLEVNDKEELQWRPGNAVIDDPLVQQQWAYTYLGMDRYHEVLRGTQPRKPAKLFILDSGVQSNHEDLARGYSRIRGQSPRDPNGHGTHCAGIAAAVTNNGKGVASFSPGTDWVQLHSLAVINGFGFAPQSAVVKAIIEATDRGADVISMSLGGRSTDSLQHAYTAAIDYATQQGVIVVAAAGNSKLPASQFIPAGCKGVIAVAAVGQAGVMAPFTNSVADVEMGVAAPGVDILSTYRDGKYKATSGTSMAAPMVAGLAAVSKALDPELTSEVFYQLVSTTGSDSSVPNETGAVIQPAEVVRGLMGKELVQ